MAILRCTLAAGVLVALLAALSVASGAGDESKLVPKPDRKVEELLDEFHGGTAPDKVIQALRAIEEERLSSALAYEIIFYERREAALHALEKIPPLKPVEPALVHALQHGTNNERLVAIALVQKWKVKAAIPVLLGGLLESDYVVTREPPRSGDDPGLPEVVAGVFSSACGALHALTDGQIGMHLRPTGATGSHEAIKAKWRAWWKDQGPQLYGNVYQNSAKVSSEEEALAFCETIMKRWGPNVDRRGREAFESLLVKYDVPPRGSRKDILPERLSAPRDLWCETGSALLLREAVIAGRKRSEADDAARSRQRAALLFLSHLRPLDCEGVVSVLAWLRKDGRVFDDAAWVEAFRYKHCQRATAILVAALKEAKDPVTLYQGADVLGDMTCLDAIPALIGLMGRVIDDGYDRTLLDGLKGLLSRGPAHEKAVVETAIGLLSRKEDQICLSAMSILASARHKVFIEAAIAAIEAASGQWTGQRKQVADSALALLKQKLEKPVRHRPMLPPR
jgi:hypothetical protein